MSFDDLKVNLNDYEIGEKISNGSFSVVFHATNKKTGKNVVLKIFPKRDNYMIELIIEIINSASVYDFLSSHEFPGTIKILGFQYPLNKKEIQKSEKHEIETTNSRDIKITVELTNYVIVTEFINSKTVFDYTANYLRTEGKSKDHMNPTIRSKIIFGVASIMKQLHRNKIIFRDLKLEKIA